MKIETKKSLIVGPQANSGVKLGVKMGAVGLVVANDGVEHTIDWPIQEAIQFAISVIQLAGYAAQGSPDQGTDRGDPVPMVRT